MHTCVDNQGYVSTLKRAIGRIRELSPAYLIVCLGADIRKGDPTGDMFITVDGMRDIGAEIGKFGVRTLVVQEGGYNLSNLRRGVRAFASGLASAHEAAGEAKKEIGA